MPPASKFLELFDSVIKRTINEIMPHKFLNLKYDVKANQVLEEASEIEIDLNSVVADDVGFKIEGNVVSLKGIKKLKVTLKQKSLQLAIITVSKLRILF
jgi:hypothetical protein